MGKHKRKHKDDELYYLFKKFAKRMRRNSSSEDSDAIGDANDEHHETRGIEELDVISNNPVIPIPDDSAEPDINNDPEGQEIKSIPPLDDEILELLGDDPSENKQYAEPIHKDIATRWDHIVKSGLEKDSSKDLCKLYPIPGNCLFLEAPLLNPEIKAAISEPVYKRDRALLNNQTSLGQVAGCIGKALNILIQKKECKEVTKIVSDAGRMVCDLFHTGGTSRRSLLQFALNKPTKDIVSQTTVGKYIFGDNLHEDLKAGKAISKTGTEIKFSRPQTSKPYTKPAPLNYRGPPRRYQPSQQTPSAGKSSSFRHKPAAASQRRAAPTRRTSHRKT